MITILLEKIKALLSELKTNIENLPTGGGGISYSTDEKEIGTWVNGKKLYQKTVYVASASFDTSESGYYYHLFDLTSLNFPRMETALIDFSGSYFELSTFRFSFIWGRVDLDSARDAVYLYIDQNRRNRPCYITIRYTKKEG